VLHRQRLSLAAIEALQPGDVIEVPDNAVNEIELTIDQPGGRKTAIATGHLGAYRGAKVVKLDIDVDPRLRQHVKAAL
jgi:flagellar motor switch protein FliM